MPRTANARPAPASDLGASSSSRGSAVAAVLGCILVLAYALPLFVPPPTAVAAPSGLFARIFPGVPAWWVWARLACLALGAALLARVAAPVPLRPLSVASGREPIARSSLARRAELMALALAAAQVASLPWVAHLSVLGQTAYMLALGAPAALLAIASAGHLRARIVGPSASERGTMTAQDGESIREPGAEARSVRLAAWLTAGVIVTWVVLRLSDAWHSPRAADAVDLWRTFGYLQRFAQDGGNFLTDPMDRELPGVTAMPLFFQGLPLLRLFGAATLTWAQAANLLWLAATAAGVAVLAAAVVGPAAAPVATAVLLWAPYTLLDPLNPSPLFMGPLYTTALWLLVLALHRYRSAAALAAFGAVAGLTVTYPSLVPMTGLATLAVAWSWYRGPRVSALVVAVAALSFVAAAVPGLPGLQGLRAMWSTYAAPVARVAVLQDVLFGQVPAVAGATDAVAGVRSGALDVVLATVLSPFAVARTPLRLWGDSLFDPLGSIFVAIGIALCLRSLRRHILYAGLLVVLAAALLPAFVSSYDQPSLLRAFALPVPVALVAALGFSAIARVIGKRPDAAVAIAVAAIVVGGTYVFDVVNPTILRSSPLGLGIRSLSVDDLERASILSATDENPSWMYLSTAAAEVPPRHIPVLDTQQTETLLARGEPDAARAEPPETGARKELFLWTPAVEESARISRAVCARWSTAALYTLSDRTGLTKLLAARPSGHGWIPRLAREQWKVKQCGAATPPVLASVQPPPESGLGAGRTEMQVRDLRSTDLTGADLRGAKLQGKKLAGALMREAKLERADLSGADLRGAVLTDANLHAADLGGADVSKADMTGASLTEANLEGADLNSATLKNADLTQARLARTHMGGADLTGARLAGADFTDAQLIEAKLSNADLSSAVLSGTNLRAAVLDGANLGGADLRRGDIASATLKGAHLRGIDASGLILRDVDLSGADLTGAKLVATDLGGANLGGANLADAVLKNARLAGASLARADLSRAVLAGADLTRADLSNAVLTGVDLTGTSIVGAKLEGLVLSGANLAGATLPGIELPGAKLVGAVLSGADLQRCDLHGADLGKADLTGARLMDCDLTSATLEQARMTGADVRGAVMDKANLAGVVLSEADLGGQRMQGAKLHGANLARSNLSGADLRDADLGGADLRDAALNGAKLAGADLRGAKLGGAMLSGSDLSGANLEGADVYRAYLAGVIWAGSRCPDGTVSTEHDETCCEHYRGMAPDSCSP